MLVAAVRAGIAIDPDEPTDVMVTLERNALAALDSLFEQLEAAQEAAQKNWDEHSERQLAALDRDPERELRRVKEQLEELSRHAEAVRDSYDLWLNGVDIAHLDHACSELNDWLKEG